MSVARVSRPDRVCVILCVMENGKHFLGHFLKKFNNFKCEFGSFQKQHHNNKKRLLLLLFVSRRPSKSW